MIGQALELRRLLNNCRLSPAKLEALRNRKLRATIRHEYENVPYYRSPFQTVGLRPEEIRNVNNLQRLSITRKDDLKTQVWDTSLRRGGDLAACQMVCTSGTTGKPFAIHLTPTDLRARRLVEFWVLLLIGFRPQGRLAVLGPDQPHSMRSHQRLGFLSPHPYFSTNFLGDQIDLRKRYRPTILWAYPTVLKALLSRVHYRLEAVASPRLLITSAEIRTRS